MSQFVIEVEVNQLVTKKVLLDIDARDEEAAQNKAKEALETYPEAVTVEGIRRIQTNKINYWTPRDVTFISTKEIKTSA